MKTSLTLIALLSLPFGAHASYMQESCSNGDGTVKIAFGHTDNSVRVSIFDIKKGKSRSVIVKDARVEVLSENEVHSESRQTCHGSTGSSYYRKVSTQKVRLTRDGGKLFDKYTSGVNEDLTAVDGIVICEHIVTNIMPCQQ